ncbi:PREDICTED: ankyrin repeat-containing [Prunus dulcis]|uniref:PREDICTED: ankyrin repeat-containing n=1 Tax=Prunus dulcis TaxID=3755 RepID=A0A5E4FWT0_PRUDU|nr:ankyrin repeat-containing protein At5g02620-like isoform X1 [Prunus dulcis]XP_034212346.1 ankyrin repeat-containing protein At5g02620-like isoform X1 [Prunus dulcis]VVA31909.1 PREDICTED: ankyrin repeat-containing [Prunus dulcis]
MDRLVYEAATSGDVGLFRRIQDGDELPDVLYKKTPKDNNVLHIAAEFKQIKFFNDIPLEYGSSLFWATNKKGDTPLHVAAKVGCVEVVEFLIEHARKSLHHMERGDEERGPADGESQNKLLQVKNSDNDTTLHLAVRYNHDEVAIRLMEADPQLCCFTNKANESPLFLAVRKGTPSIVHCILKAYESGVSPSFQGTNGLTALHAAVTQEQLKDKDVVEILVSKNRDLIKEVDAIGWTPLHYAAFTGNVEATQLLMESDSSASYIMDLSSKMSALHVAAYAGHTKVMEELIRYQPDTCDLVNSKGQTVLHSAILGGQGKVVNYILRTPKLTGLINEADEDGNTPLHIAVKYKKVEIISILTADRRVDKDAVNKKVSKAIDIFLGQNSEEQGTIDSPVLHQLGSCVGGPFFQQKISNDFNKPETSEKDTPGTSAIEHKRQSLQSTSNQALKRLDTKLVVTTLIATVTFAAAVTPPGGFKSDGKSVLSEDTFFKVFQLFNQVTFMLAIIAIYNESNPIRISSIEIATPESLIRYSIGGLLVAFFSATMAVMPERRRMLSLRTKPFTGQPPFDVVLNVIGGFAVALVSMHVIWTMHRKLRRNNRPGCQPCNL